MSKMACGCGYIISNVHFPSPTEGWIVREEDQEALLHEASRGIVAFVAACAEGRRAEWLRTRFSDQYPADSADAEIVSDILSDSLHDRWISVCECQNCGRLHVQRRNDENRYLAYAPDAQQYQAVLKADDRPGCSEHLMDS